MFTSALLSSIIKIGIRGLLFIVDISVMCHLQVQEDFNMCKHNFYALEIKLSISINTFDNFIHSKEHSSHGKSEHISSSPINASRLQQTLPLIERVTHDMHNP